jgi:hypothetical protein
LARVAELADAYGSGPYGETRGGSSPLASSPLVSPTLALPRRGKTTGVPRCQVESTDYFAAALLLAAQRAFINWESLLRPAGVSPPFDLAGAVFVPAALLLAAQRAFINRESLRRPAGVSAPFFPAGAVFVVPFSFDQRALAAAASFARVAGEK